MMKLKSFSFLEILVSIIISGIVISTAYSVYVFTYKQFFKFTATKTEMRSYFELSTVLKKDFETAKKIIKLNEQEVVMDLTDKQINYSFSDNILRTIQEHTDTFFLETSNIEINVTNELKEEALIDYLQFNIQDKTEDKVMSFHKNYGAIIHIKD